MPQGDRTGPMGQGSRTGRRLGFCSGYDSPGFTRGFGEPGRGRGFGPGSRPGRGRAMGWRHGQMPFEASPPNREEEIRLLQTQAASLKQAQQNLEERLEELQKNNRS